MKHSTITHDEFEARLFSKLEKMTANQLIGLPGFYEIVSEEFNNEILDDYEAGDEGCFEPALRVDPQGEGSDYTLVDHATSCWITVGGLSVWIRRLTDEPGVAVEIHPHLREAEGPPLDCCLASDPGRLRGGVTCGATTDSRPSPTRSVPGGTSRPTR